MQTNYERIKNMTIEQLAESNILGCTCCTEVKNFGNCNPFACNEYILKWLQQEGQCN